MSSPPMPKMMSEPAVPKSDVSAFSVPTIWLWVTGGAGETVTVLVAATLSSSPSLTTNVTSRFAPLGGEPLVLKVTERKASS